MRKVKIGDKLVGGGERCFIIAEGGINHNGDIELAKKMIEEAALAKADAIKFQTHIPEKEMLKGGFTADYVGESLFDLLKKVEFSEDDHIELKKYAEKRGILLLSTPFSREASDLLERIEVPAYKIGSGEIMNFPLLEHIAKKGKPLILSTGMSNLEEIKESYEFVRRFNENIILMHCTSSYPSKYEDINLRVIPNLIKQFKVPVGLSDHSIGIYTALASVALGASVIEKHFTLDRDLPGPDQKASITPGELVELVIGTRAIEKALGDKKIVTQEEMQIRKMARESVVSLVDIPNGAIITQDMVWVKRPGTGIPAKHLNEVIGRKVVKDIKADSLINWEDLD